MNHKIQHDICNIVIFDEANVLIFLDSQHCTRVLNSVPIKWLNKNSKAEAENKEEQTNNKQMFAMEKIFMVCFKCCASNQIYMLLY